MSILFGDYTIPGTHEELDPSPWNRQAQPTTVFGQPGTTELTGQLTNRTIAVSMWLHDEFATVGELGEVIQEIELLAIQGSAEMSEIDGTEFTFPDCKFDRFIKVKGPLYDPVIGWWMDCVLIFIQLTPPEIPEE